MSDDRFISYKYNGNLSTRVNLVKIFILVSIVLFLFWFTTVVNSMLPALLAVAVIIYAFSRGSKGQIIIGKRFLVINDDIVYYKNIASIRVYKKKQFCVIQSKQDKDVYISAQDFPTNARKDFKIERNKKGKFVKVVNKLSENFSVEDQRTLFKYVE